MNPDHCRAFAAALIVNAAMLVSAPASAADLAYAVQPGDILTVSVWKEPSLQSPVRSMHTARAWPICRNC
jgi:protein involved in polysaccharide export with SLBB domain